ncbi:MAG: signal recognition particle-docking protein FtsY [Anaerolineae bacterium]|nr:signal recognition particle-docking protein FtsY [Anaerolineae bacterium]
MVLRRLRAGPEGEQADEQKIQQSLSRTRQGFFGRIGGLLGQGDIGEETWEELEELLILADVGVNTALPLVERLRQRVARERIRSADGAQAILREELIHILNAHPPVADSLDRLLTVVLVVGVNGSGKTTSIAKLARYYQNRGKRVVLGAADTFRAAAIEQLKIWGQRVGADVIAHQPGSDPGAVVYDAIRASQESRHADVLIVDTAGRLHTKYNLMEELKKLRRVAAKQVHRAPHEVFLVLDATTGQNALSQARVFKDAVDITGIILTKLDSTAKGGIVFAIVQELGLPIRFVGTGEKIEDFAEFDAQAFVEGLFANS